MPLSRGALSSYLPATSDLIIDPIIDLARNPNLKHERSPP